jgi:hypothetical protein
MRAFTRSLLLAAVVGGLWCGVAMAADLSTVGKWTKEDPSTKIVDGKSLWDQPGVQMAMRAAMGEHFFTFSQEEKLRPEAPVASNGKGLFAAWSCTEADDCGGNQITVFFDSAADTAQICLRSSEGIGGKVQDLWLANGNARPLPINGCGVGERDPFASLKRYGGAGDGKQP